MENSKLVETVVEQLNQTGKVEITVREGKAKDLLPEQAVKEVKPLFIKGIGGTIASFINRRMHLYNPDNCRAEVDMETGQIKLTLNEKQENDKHIDCVCSEYPINKKITELKLNSGFGRTAKDMFTFLRNYKIYAANKVEFQNLLSKLGQFKAKIDAEINQSDNRKGDYTNSIIKKTLHEVPENFFLNIPLIGSQIVSFKIDIEFNSATELFELWSDDFIEKYESIVIDNMNKEIEEIKNFCLTIFV